jgi:hypothetical protein
MKLKRVTIPTAFLLLAVAMQASCVDRTEVSLSSEAKETKTLITNHMDYSQPYLIKDWLAVDPSADPLNNDPLLNPISSDPAVSESVEKIQMNAEYLQLITNHMLFGDEAPSDPLMQSWSTPTAQLEEAAAEIKTDLKVQPEQKAQAGNVYTDTPWAVPTSFAPTPLLPTPKKTSALTLLSKSSEVRSTKTGSQYYASPARVAPQLTAEQIRQRQAAINKNYVLRANAQREARAAAPTRREVRVQAIPEARDSSVVDKVTTTFSSAFHSLVRRETTKTRCSYVRGRRVCRSGNVSKSKCKEAVNDILTKHGMLRQRIPGNQAIDAHYWLSNPKHGFKNIKSQVGSSRKAPVGSILVYEDITPWKKKSARHGHIEIRTKPNQYCSDFCTDRPIDSSNWLRRLVGIYVPNNARIRR